MPNLIELDVLRLAEAQHGVISASQAREHGFTRGMIATRLRNGRWVAAVDGVYVVAGAPSTWRQRLMVGVLEAGPTGLVSVDGAGALHRLRGFREGPVVVTKAGKLDHRVSTAVRHETRALPLSHRTVIDGIPVTTMARTLFDLMASRHPDQAPALLDNAMVDHGFRIAELQQVFDDLARRGRKGTAVVRALLEARHGSYVPLESALEHRFLRLVTDGNLPMPDRQVVLGDDDGPIGRVDFLFRAQSLVVEVDGARHHTSPSAVAADETRDLRLRAVGFGVLRVPEPVLLHDPARVLRDLRTHLRTGGRSASI